MTTTRPNIPPTNLKERIAALEQRNAGNSSGASRPTSPTPNAAPPPVTGALAAGFRDKIAKFEKKGGVPVPRGSFGLGAPPALEGPRRRGELYGNRIPAPARSVSGGVFPNTRASSPTETLGFGTPGTSPTYEPGDRRSFSLSSVMTDFDYPNDYTPISSPTSDYTLDSPDPLVTLANDPEVSTTTSLVEDLQNKARILRGTSFQKALEVARNAEAAKLEGRESILSTPRQQQPDDGEAEAEPVPAIIVSRSSVDEPPDVMRDSPPAATPRPLPSVPEAPVRPEIKVSEPEIITEEQKEVAAPQAHEEVVAPVFPVNPLSVRKRRPTDPSPLMYSEPELVPPVPVAPIVVVHEPHADDAPATPTVMVHEASPTKSTHGDTSTPSSSETVEIKGASRKVIQPLNSEQIDNSSPTSPPETGNTSVGPLVDLLGNYFTATDANGEPIARPVTPPSHSTASTLSPMATLAYDAPETPEQLGKPTAIEVPDPQSFLSPPATGLRSSAPSSGGASYGSSLGSSMGSRPMSMIETSQVSRAMRMTPATSRGVPMFLPPTNSAQPRKSDFVYFPPTPEDSEFNSSEFGSVSLHKASHSLSMGPPRRASDVVINDPAARSNTTFTAVVHGKIRETLSATVPSSFRQQAPVPETPKRVRQMTMSETPFSPAHGELAALLQEAVLLEDVLDRGELPTEANVRLEAEEKERKKREAMAAEAVRTRRAAEEQERRRIAAETERLQAKREEPTSGRLKHTFLVPLSKARSVRRKETSTPQLDSFLHHPPPEPFVRPKSAGIPEHSTRTSQSSQRPVTPENPDSRQFLETPPKSSRFASFRRMGSVSSRPNTIHGHSNRHSVSTSSDDSAPVMTPPEGTIEFAASKHSTVSDFGHMPTHGSTTSFPTLSPKKSSASIGIGRAASFAEKMFSRSRTKSNGSILSTNSAMTVSTIDRIPEDAPSLPVFSIPTIPVSNTPAIVLPISETETKVLHPPKRSTSLARSSRLPPIPTEVVPPLPSITPSAFFSSTGDTGDVSGESLMLPHITGDDTRPSSWTSMSSAGSLPSPLFDQALFDAFPSVPEMTPALSGTTSLHRAPSHPRQDPATISYERPSFDSDFLSSAIHLASSRKTTAPALARSATYASRRSEDTSRR